MFMGKAPFYKETFIDEGDVDIVRVLKILKRNNFNGVITPDHTLQMSLCGTMARGHGLCLRLRERNITSS